MAWWSRKRIARELGVSPQRVHQLEASGALMPPSTSKLQEFAGWPETYAESFIGRRLGRRVSQSVFGLSPAQTPAQLDDDLVIQVHSDDRPPYFAMRFVHAEASIVVLQALATPVAPVFDSTSGEGYVAGLWNSTGQAVRLAAVRAAALWLDGDITGAAFIVVTEEHGGARYDEIVLIDDPEAPAESSLYRLNIAPGERLPQAEASHIDVSVLAQKLGRKVPVFAPKHFTLAVLERWQADGRNPITVRTDYSGYEEKVVAATILNALPSIAREDRALMVDALLTNIKWDESGVAPELLPWVVAGLADWRDDSTAAVPQLLLENPNFAKRLPAELRERAAAEPPSADQFIRLANATQDLIFNTFGEHGDTPSIRLVHALTLAIRAVYDRASHTALMMDPTGDTEEQQKFYGMSPIGHRPYSLRSWTSDRMSLHPLTTAYEAGFKVDQPPTDAPFRAIKAALLKHAEHYVDDAAMSQLRPQFFLDAHGVHVGRVMFDRDGERHVRYTAAVPVLRESDPVHERLRQFTSLVVEPNAQDRPVLLDAPVGPTVMPFGQPETGGFTHGYGGTGPSNLSSAIQRFVERIRGHELPEATRSVISSIVQGTPQNKPLILSSDLLT